MKTSEKIVDLIKKGFSIRFEPGMNDSVIRVTLKKVNPNIELQAYTILCTEQDIEQAQGDILAAILTQGEKKFK